MGEYKIMTPSGIEFRSLLEQLRMDTCPIDYRNPGAIVDCWNEVFDTLDMLEEQWGEVLDNRQEFERLQNDLMKLNEEYQQLKEKIEELYRIIRYQHKR